MHLLKLPVLSPWFFFFTIIISCGCLYSNAPVPLTNTDLKKQKDKQQGREGGGSSNAREMALGTAAVGKEISTK